MVNSFLFPEDSARLGETISRILIEKNTLQTISLIGWHLVKKRDDLNDVIREERSRGKKRPIDTDTIKQQADRRDAVLRIFRRGTREDLSALLKTWGYSQEEIEAALKDYDAALEQQSP